MAGFESEAISHSSTVSLEGSVSEIETRLLPVPDYYDKIWEDLPDAHPFDIQRSIVNKWDRPFDEKSKYGENWYIHVLRLMKMLMPKTVITPWFLDEALAVQTALANQCEIVNFIGSKSSGKSAFLARLPMTLVAANPEYTICYAAAPYKNAADYTIWGEMENCFKEIQKEHKEVYPGMRYVSSLNKCIFSDKKAKAGRVELVGLDRVGRLQGAKSEDATKGFLIIVADEVAIFQTQAFVEIIANVTANQNILILTGCNFKDTMGMEGILCNPRRDEYASLLPDVHFSWFSDYNSYTLRLDGHRSPNVIITELLRAKGELGPEEEKILYPFLLSEKKRSNMEEIHNKTGPKYLEQIRSFPNMATSENFILTQEQLRSGGSMDDFWERTGQWQRVAFCDPGWGGDPCKIGGFEFGPARVQAHDGSMQDTTIFKPIGPIETLKVESGKIADVDYLARLDKHSDSPIMLLEGRTVTMDNQIGLQCAEFLQRHSIPKMNFAFDASCRGSITQEMITVVGREIKAYDFQGRPTEFQVDSTGTLAADRYRNLRTEMYFLVQLVVLAGQMRGAHEIMDALAQICRHRYHQLGAKIAVEPKDEYKKCNQGKSPDAADVLVGALHVARRRGLPLSFSRNSKMGLRYQPLENLSSLRQRPKAPRLGSRNR